MISRRAVAGWFGLLLLVIAGLHGAGTGTLATPGISSSTGWVAWLSGTDPVVVAFALVRLLVLAGAWYLLAVWVLGAVVRLRGDGALVAIADRLTVPIVRRLLAATLSAGIATSSLGALATGAGAQAEPPPTITMHRLSEGEPPQVALPAAPVPVPAPVPGLAPATTREWRVEPGQCFWTIAADVVAAAWDRVPSDAEIVAYWRRLIDANRAALSDPDNPDLIFPGQFFTVPAP